ncbi:hypothetical protein EDD15DRAFT_2198155 [Pisolithus albus]|nr:hypothetical protein EDD15DRAFT_2198155 [Pisolithus albus]
MLWFCTRLSSLFVTCGHALLFFDVLVNALIGQQYYWSPVVTSVVPVRTFETIDEPRDAVVRVPIAARSQDGRRTTLPLISSQIFNFRLGGVARVKAANGDRKYFPSLSDSGEGRCSERRKKRRTMWNCCYMMEEASDAHAEATEQLDEYGLWLSRPHYKTLGILMCDQRVAPASAGVPLAKAFAHDSLIMFATSNTSRDTANIVSKLDSNQPALVIIRKKKVIRIGTYLVSSAINTYCYTRMVGGARTQPVNSLGTGEFLWTLILTPPVVTVLNVLTVLELSFRVELDH